MTASWTPPAQPVRVIKIGGSLITDRSRRAAFKEDCVDAFAEALAALQADGELDDFVLILGGGSFAHDIVHEHQINRPNWRNVKDFFELPASLYRLQTLVTERLRRAGLPGVPLQ
ncbi:MAG: hypothetical protein QF805_30475, partial [Pirellulaceae bacterium]|nr:hypothetical protein [Pirellulaceae bacterium]